MGLKLVSICSITVKFCQQIGVGKICISKEKMVPLVSLMWFTSTLICEVFSFNAFIDCHRHVYLRVFNALKDAK